MSESKLCPVPGCGAEMIEHEIYYPHGHRREWSCPHGDESSPYHQKCRENAELEASWQHTHQQRCLRYEDQLDEVREECGSLKSDNAALRAQLEISAHTLAEVEGHLTAMDAHAHQWRNRCERSEDAFKDVEKELGEVIADNAALRAQVENIKAQIRREIPPADKDVAALFEEWQKVCDEDAASNAQCNEAWSKDKAQRDALLREKAERSKAAQDVLAERQRQITQEGWTPAHDDEHDQGELAMAAACYALPEEEREMHEHPEQDFPFSWPWPGHWWKPGERRRDLVKAGALILAEIERLDRANPEPPTCGHPVEVKG